MEETMARQGRTVVERRRGNGLRRCSSLNVTIKWRHTDRGPVPRLPFRPLLPPSKDDDALPNLGSFKLTSSHVIWSTFGVTPAWIANVQKLHTLPVRFFGQSRAVGLIIDLHSSSA
eukprot:scaffold1588_cov214-Alexandrium_tamarense.AAC.4